MKTLEEVRGRIAEIDARIKAERKLRAMWAAFERALVEENKRNPKVDDE